MRSRRVLVGLLGALLLAGCGGGTPDLDVVTAGVTKRQIPKLTDRKDIDRVADASTAFALDLYQRVAADQKLKGKNLVLGPFSTWLALTMLSAGANGKTAEELAEVLHHPFPEDRLLTAINALEGTIKHRTDDEDTRAADQRASVRRTGQALRARIPRRDGRSVRGAAGHRRLRRPRTSPETHAS